MPLGGRVPPSVERTVRASPSEGGEPGRIAVELMYARGMRGALIGWVLVSLGTAGCGETAPSTDGVGEALPAPEPRAREVDPIYDENGIPRESDVVVAGLTLPRGLEELEALREDRTHVYASVVPREPLLRYFGPRLNTLDIRHVGASVSYIGARPRDARGGVVLLDVHIRPSAASGEETRVEVHEQPPPMPEGMRVSEDEVRRRLEELAAQPRE